MRSKFSFLYENVEFHVPKCKIILKKQFKELVVFSKIIFGFNFEVPLTIVFASPDSVLS